MCVWEHDVCAPQAVPYASGAGTAAYGDRRDALGVAPRRVSGLWLLEQSPGARRACHRVGTTVACCDGRSGRGLWERAADRANLLCLGTPSPYQLGGYAESP